MLAKAFQFLALIILCLPIQILCQQPEDDITIQYEEDVDINRKSKESKQMVLKGINHLSKVSLEKACDDFIHNPAWRKGELFVFVFTADGTCLAHGDDHYLIWRNLKDIKQISGAPLLKDFLATGVKGGRISYLWDNGFKSCYIKSIVKQGERYLLGCGFYPENDEYTSKQMVKTAVTYFMQNGKDATFALMSNPKGPFVKGDIYMFANDFSGINVAHGNNPALNGQNMIDLVDSRGKKITAELIKIAKTKGKGWLDFYWKNEFKRAYAEKVVDPKTKIPYMIAAGYYPNVNLKVVKNFVNRAVRFVQDRGSKVAFAEFNNLVGQFAQGGLGIFVFDLNGKNLANGENPALVGQNLLKVTSDDGRFYVQNFIETAQREGKGLVSYRNYNTEAVAYVELVKTPDGTFVIGAEYFPSSKLAATQTLVNRAIDYFKANSIEKSCMAFTAWDNTFVRGDLRIFMYTSEATQLADGTVKSRIWENFLKTTDQAGKPAVSDIVTVAINGGGWVQYKWRNATRKVYAKAVEKTLEDGTVKNFIIGSGYYL